MLGKLRAIWRRLPIPYAVRARVSPLYGIVLNRLTRGRRSKPLAPHLIAPGPVIVSGFLGDVTGIGRAGRLTVEKLSGWGVPLVTHDIRLDPGAESLREHPAVGGVWVCHCNPPQVLETLANGADAVWAGRYRIGYWAYELQPLPSDWQTVIPYFHEIWAPSAFVADAIRSSQYARGVTVRVMPHPLPDFSAATRNPALLGYPGRFTFLAMFDARSSFARKNPMGTLLAFQQAFTPAHEGVALVLKVVAADAEPASLKALAEQAAGWPNVRIMTEHLSDGEAVQLIASADCLVSLHRSEGFGLTIAEAMTVGTPVIATDWSGNVDFSRGAVMDIPYTLVPTEDISGRYAKTGAAWAEPDIAAAAEAMRRIAADPEFREQLIAMARRQVVERLDVDYSSAPYERFIARSTGESDAMVGDQAHR
ncbi:MAG: glycosyltransferase family 4 protein [Devosia sp.]